MNTPVDDYIAKHGQPVNDRPEQTVRELELTALLNSACCIAERKGADTAWERFVESANKLGIYGITARTYRVLPSDLQAPGDSPDRPQAQPAAELIRDIHAEIVKRATWWHCQTNDLHGINMAVNVAMIEVANSINKALLLQTAQSKAEVAV